jgi:hypothetical protein
MQVNNAKPNDGVVAAILVLCLHANCDGEISGAYSSHLSAARSIIFSAPLVGENALFLVEYFWHFDTVRYVTCVSTAVGPNISDLKISERIKSGPGFGSINELFTQLENVRGLRDLIRARQNEGCLPKISMEVLNYAVDVDRAIMDWKPDNGMNSEWIAAGRILQASALVYLHHAIHLSGPESGTTRIVNEALEKLETFSAASPAFGILLLPTFLIGCNTFESAQRQTVIDVLAKRETATRFRNLELVKRVLVRVWTLLDSSDGKYWDLEITMHTMGLDFLMV